VVGDGTKAFHDPIVVPNESAEGGRTNPFFVDFYQVAAMGTRGLEAREHTAQVPYEDRVKREELFREGKLPILYCSPTMELGVDIKELNVVNLRNIPPTPANYAQRSGRAGRSGQPALVFSYCTTGSPHDQYFFKRPERMVAGAVTPPRLDLANEDLVRAHVHAIWLAETRLSLGKSLKDILDLSGEEPTLALQGHVRDAIADPGSRKRARVRAAQILSTFHDELAASDWYHDDWLEQELARVGQRFEQACERWRGLYRAAMAQAKAQDRIIRDAARSADDKRQAERLRREAEEQLRLLTEVENIAQSDFYSYRYMASEGFLPGYSFPRLPLSAFIPARRTKQRDEFLSRPRFLAISEFGPRAIVYHEGSRYIINKVILPVEEDNVLTRRAKLCSQCGYLHPMQGDAGSDLCERCGAPLDSPLRQLFRLQNVSTKRRDKINSDEEERMRQGFEIITSVRFADQSERPSHRTATIEREGDVLARLTYGQSATLWRINLGWKRRKNKEQYGFMLDVERGYWAKSDQENEDQTDPMSPRTERVVPFVEDRRNCLLFEPTQRISMSALTSLMSAIKGAIQVHFQLEDDELAAEPLPSETDRRLILFYESAEGGAGVLRRLLDDPQTFALVAQEALRLCHFDAETGEDLHRAPRAREDCEAACYDCLLNYYNQRDHKLLDRTAIRDLLMQLSQTRVISAPAGLSRAEHLQRLMRLAASELERKWLRYLDARGHNLPTHAQMLIEACSTRPDFLYDELHAAIYIDGPHHDYPERQTRDKAQTECMEDHGYTVIRFGLEKDWDKIIAQFPYIFGRPK
jgi:very-short-patch-repair endonuclease